MDLHPPSSSSILPAVLFAGPLLAAAWLDATRLRLPNWLTAMLALLFPCAALLGAGPVGWSQHAGGALLLGAAALLPFAAGWMGGGDVKLLAAVGLWLGLPALPLFVGILGLTSLALGVGVLAARGIAGGLAAWRGRATGPSLWLLQPGAPVPYGLAISAAALLASGVVPMVGGGPPLLNIGTTPLVPS